MCNVFSDKGKYSVLITDKNDHPICTIQFCSISTLARWLADFDFQYADCSVFKNSDWSFIDPKLLLEIWSEKK